MLSYHQTSGLNRAIISLANIVITVIRVFSTPSSEGRYGKDTVLKWDVGPLTEACIVHALTLHLA